MADAPHSREPEGEDDVRELFQRYTSAVEPASDALRRIRRQVPRRRARRRQLAVGAVAGAVLLAVAVPRFVGLGALGRVGGPDVSATYADGDASGGPSDQGSAADSEAPESGDLPPSAKPCLVSDLGRSAVSTGQPDAQGRRVGWFTLYNTTGRICSLVDTGVLRGVDAASTPGAVTAVHDHVAGDQGTRLRTPPNHRPTLKLDPQDGLRVEFEWVPTTPCRAVGGGAAAHPGSVTLEYLPPVGGKGVRLSFPVSCSGTVYRASGVEEERDGTIEVP